MGMTSKQIAELAGVSRGTVDRALHRRGGVKPEVQQRIEALARQYGYRPGRAGKALVMQQALKVGLALNAAGNPFFDEVNRGIRAALEDYSDFPIELCRREARGYDVATQLRHIGELDKEGIAGLVVTPINHPEVAGLLNRLADTGRPVVALNSDLDGCRRLAYVGCNYESSGRTAAQLLGLLTGGKGRVLVVTGSIRVMGHNQRVTGFSRVLRTDFPGMDIVDVAETNDDDARAAREVAAAMTAHPDIDVLYFCAGGIAGGVEAAHATAQGRRLTIVGSDLTPDTRRLLETGRMQASIGQQPYEQGYNAMKTLLSRLLFRQEPAAERLYTANEIHIKYNI